MPIVPPRLDDRSFDDLVAELLARIPAHTPEWTDPRPGDPGRTLLELFAWLTDTLLYRANLIPERQRLVFLRLLGEALRPAIAAEGLVSLQLDEAQVGEPVTLAPFATLEGPVPFETRGELTVQPVSLAAYYKRPLSEAEAAELDPVLLGLQEVYGLESPPRGYVTTPVFANGMAEPGGFDLMEQSVDQSLWLALLAPGADQVTAARQALGSQQLLNVGVAPALTVPALFEDIGERGRLPHVWEITSGRVIDGEPEYLQLDVLADSSAGLARPGVLRLALPDDSRIGGVENDVRQDLNAGVGDRPPRFDDPDTAARLVAWLRLRPTGRLARMAFSWVGINAVTIDQRRTLSGRIVGQSDGRADQRFELPGRPVEADSLVLQVEAPGRGYIAWRISDDLATAGPDDPLFELDSEAATVRFGDGLRGRIPDTGMRIRVARLRAGGGTAGNLPAGTLGAVSALDPAGQRIQRPLKVHQPLPTRGGVEAETLAEAERRIPARLRHRERAVTADDYRELATATPGVRIGRVEVLPGFKPQQRREDVPGVVSVMALPYKARQQAPNPRPDRPFIERIHAYLEARRPLGTELYVIGCEYLPLAVGVGITLRPGAEHDAVLHGVRAALREYLWPLPPGGPGAAGWPLDKATVRDRELEVVIARVTGVNTVLGVNLFRAAGAGWALLPRPRPGDPVELPLLLWQLPELQALAVVVDSEPPESLRAAPGVTGEDAVAVPVTPEVC